MTCCNVHQEHETKKHLCVLRVSTDSEFGAQGNVNYDSSLPHFLPDLTVSLNLVYPLKIPLEWIFRSGQVGNGTGLQLGIREAAHCW